MDFTKPCKLNIQESSEENTNTLRSEARIFLKVMVN